MSEMGRTPALNANLGKDHWPFTSVMLIGDGFIGDRVVGGFDAGWMGQSLDFGSAEVTDGGRLRPSRQSAPRSSNTWVWIRRSTSWAPIPCAESS